MELKTYTVKETQKILKVGEKSIRNYIRDKKLTAAKIGKKWVIMEKDLESFLQENKI